MLRKPRRAARPKPTGRGVTPYGGMRERASRRSITGITGIIAQASRCHTHQTGDQSGRAAVGFDSDIECGLSRPLARRCWRNGCHTAASVAGLGAGCRRIVEFFWGATHRVVIKPLLVETIQRLPESTLPSPGIVSPREAFQMPPPGPSNVAVPSTTLRKVQPWIVVGLVSGTGTSLRPFFGGDVRSIILHRSRRSWAEYFGNGLRRLLRMINHSSNRRHVCARTGLSSRSRCRFFLLRTANRSRIADFLLCGRTLTEQMK
jgi:hypothetical protein